MKNPHHLLRQRGLTLVELLVALAITLFIVAAAGYVYLGTRETQRAIERRSSSTEIGAFAMQLIGRDLMNAGSYPATMPPVSDVFPTRRQFDSYPPIVGVPPRATDWISPADAYLTPVFGCEGAKFLPATGTCDATDEDKPDSLVVNYFTSDPVDNETSQRRDCTGADVGEDTSNAVRKLNDGGIPRTTMDKARPPQLPLFGSNRYVLEEATPQPMDGSRPVKTFSLSCAGNGAKDKTVFTPMVTGIEDMQLTYGIFNTEQSRVPEQFYTAKQIKDLKTINVDGTPMTPWARVVAVRVCLMTKTLGDQAKIADEAGKERSYTDCKDQVITQSSGDTALYQRHVEVFSLRNRMNQTF